MNSFIVLAFVAALGVANASLIGHGHSTVLQGPSSKTTLVGPDGSHISGHAPGGQAATTVDVGYTAHGYEHTAAVIAPVVAHAAPIVAHATPIVSHAGSAVAHSSIVRVDQIHSSPVFTHAAPIVAAHGVYGHGLGLAGHGLGLTGHGLELAGHGFAGHGYGHAGYPIHAAGSGLEGQYVHDYTETLYDDGSYKGEHYHH